MRLEGNTAISTSVMPMTGAYQLVHRPPPPPDGQELCLLDIARDALDDDDRVIDNDADRKHDGKHRREID